MTPSTLNLLLAKLNSIKNIILILCVLVVTVMLFFTYKPLEPEKKSEILTASQLEQRSEDYLNASETMVKIPTHHSDAEKKK